VANIAISVTVVPKVVGGNHPEGSDRGEGAYFRAAQAIVRAMCVDMFAFETSRKIEIVREHVARIRRLTVAWIG
jgi:hypothetical protein